MQLGFSKLIKDIRFYFSPLGKFTRATKASKLDRRDILCAMKYADRAFKQNPKAVLLGLTRMNGYEYEPAGEGIIKKRNHLLTLVNPSLAHDVKIAAAYSDLSEARRLCLQRGHSQSARRMIDALKKSSKEMLENGQVIKAYDGFLCLSESHYDGKERAAAADIAVSLVGPCTNAGAERKMLAFDLHSRLQYTVSDFDSLAPVWKKLEFQNFPLPYKGSRLDHICAP